MEDLKDAIDHGRVDDVLHLLDVSPGLEIEYDVTSSFSVLLSPLHYAAKEGKLEVCMALYKGFLIEERVSKVYCSILSQDLSPEEIENNEFVRSREGLVFSSDTLQALFNYNKRNENPQTRSYMGNEVFEMPNKYTPLHYSVLGGHIGVVDLFLSTGNHEDQVYSALQLAACIGSSEAVINLLLDKCVEYPKANTYTPLVLSILYDEWKSLFCKEQWFEIESPEGKKALEYAVKFNRVELVEKILEAGGDVLTINADRESVLDIALNKGSLEVLRLCLLSLYSETLLILQTTIKKQMYKRIVDAILEKNVDFIESIYALPWKSPLFGKDYFKYAGYTDPIMTLLVQTRQIELLPHFLKCRTSLDECDMAYFSPLDIAVINEDLEAIDALISAGVSVNSGWGALNCAAKARKWDLCIHMLELEKLTQGKNCDSVQMVRYAKNAQKFDFIALVVSKYMDLALMFEFLDASDKTAVLNSSNFDWDALLEKGASRIYRMYNFSPDEADFIMSRFEPSWANVAGLVYSHYPRPAVHLMAKKIKSYFSIFSGDLRPVSSKNMQDAPGMRADVEEYNDVVQEFAKRPVNIFD